LLALLVAMGVPKALEIWKLRGHSFDWTYTTLLQAKSKSMNIEL